MSSSGRARSMKAWRLERNTRKRWSRRMSTDAGWTHFGSNGSIPMRPASIAARMSRSERTTPTEYAGLGPTKYAHRLAELAPRAHGPLGVRQRRTREAPQHLDGVRAGGLAHREIRRAVADHDRFVRRDPETAHGVAREIRGRLRPRHRIAPEINVDVLLDPDAAQDPLAVSERAVQIPQDRAERRSLSGGDGARARR